MRSRLVPGLIVMGIHICWVGATGRYLVLASVHAAQHSQEQGQDAAGLGRRTRSSPEVLGHHSILETADALVQRCLDIIAYWRPRYWFIENPQTGLLKTRDVVQGIPYVDLDYCMYGAPYRKRTRI